MVNVIFPGPVLVFLIITDIDYKNLICHHRTNISPEVGKFISDPHQSWKALHQRTNAGAAVRMAGSFLALQLCDPGRGTALLWALLPCLSEELGWLLWRALPAVIEDKYIILRWSGKSWPDQHKDFNLIIFISECSNHKPPTSAHWAPCSSANTPLTSGLCSCCFLPGNLFPQKSGWFGEWGPSEVFFSDVMLSEWPSLITVTKIVYQRPGYCFLFTLLYFRSYTYYPPLTFIYFVCLPTPIPSH